MIISASIAKGNWISGGALAKNVYQIFTSLIRHQEMHLAVKALPNESVNIVTAVPSPKRRKVKKKLEKIYPCIRSSLSSILR